MTNSTGTLLNKRVILLGASAGLGLATAKAAAAEGANVVIVSSNQGRIDLALKELPEKSEGYAVDLSTEENIKGFFEKIGNFDHLVYTAGESLSLNVIDKTEIEAAKDFFNLRFWSAFTAVKYGSPLINQGGSICLTSGTAGQRPGKGWSLGSSICAAMEGFTRAMAVELAPIRVNIVAPGIVKTGLWDNMEESHRAGMYQHYSETLLVKRIGEAEDIAQTYVYLMKQQYGTGQVITVDGGGVLV